MWTQTHTEKAGKMKAETGDASTSQGMPKITSIPAEARRQAWVDFPSVLTTNQR